MSVHCSKQERNAFSILTPRERDVLSYVAQGVLNKVIASELNISPRTVEVHRARIFRKLGVRNAVQLLQRLVDEGWHISAFP